MEPELRQIVYASKATRSIPPEELAGILEVARANNQAKNITGMLLYRSGHFLQVLEGPLEPLEALLKKLKLDLRHSGVRVLLDQPLTARCFGTWSMAFKDVSGLEPDKLRAYSQFLDQGFSSTECVRYPHKVLRMVLAFRDTNLERFESVTANAPGPSFLS